jgi:acetyl-CoA carboxylase carboxyltransferase component
MASHLEIDDVIDPAETRDWLLRVLAVACAGPLPPRRPFIDTW